MDGLGRSRWGIVTSCSETDQTGAVTSLPAATHMGVFRPRSTGGWMPPWSVRRSDWALAASLWTISTALAIPALIEIGRIEAWIVVGVIQSGQAGALVWRRRNVPLMGAVLTVATALQLALTDAILISDLAVLIGLYSAARWSSSRTTRSWALGLGLFGALVGSIRWPVEVVPVGVGVYFLFLGGFVTLSWSFGDVARRRRQYTEGLEEQNRILQAEQVQAALLAAATERNAIARELHDVLAHSLALIAVQAEGASFAMRTGDSLEPDQVAESLSAISDTARTSLAETRQVVREIREFPPALTPPGLLNGHVGHGDLIELAGAGAAPGLQDVPSLCQRVLDAGRQVTLRLDGDISSLEGDVDRAAYRIVQESLTNVLKHASSEAAVTVDIVRGEVVLKVAITNDGVPPTAHQTPAGATYGLVGIGERVRSLGGTFSAGPAGSDGFAVHVEIPTGDS